jgi:hypothetical protein
MTPEARQQLIEALRSGRYQQLRRRFHDNHGHCVMGVAEELGILSGITQEEGLSLIELNDNGSSFSYIANWLERRDPCRSPVRVSRSS